MIDTEKTLSDLRLWLTPKAARRLPEADVEDGVQEAITEAWKSLSRYNEERGEIWPYLTVVARRALNRYVARFYEKRAKAAVFPLSVNDYDDTTDGIDHTAEDGIAASFAEPISAALAMLPERQRQAVYGMDVLGLTSAEVADRLGLKEASGIRQARRAGLATLRRELADLEGAL